MQQHVLHPIRTIDPTRLSRALSGGLFALASGFASIAQGQAWAADTYMDLEQYVENQHDGSAERWFNAESILKSDFDQVCGDTFCEGDYANLQSLGIYCSVAASTGRLRACKWLFAGSHMTVAPKTGAQTFHRKVFTCGITPTGSITATQLMDVLLATDAKKPIDRPLPGSGRSLYEMLQGCL